MACPLPRAAVPAWWRRPLLSRSGPVWTLLLVVAVSLGLRVAWLGAPCRSPCRTPAEHQLVFDETYYVPAARTIAGLAPVRGQRRYAGAPSGDDPNAEHPQLIKLATAGAMLAFGDGPFAWRLASLVAGTLAILGMYALARAAGAGGWLAVAGAALAAGDNLALVHGRIGTLDMPVLAAMVWAVALYLRGRTLAGGSILGVGACMKLVAPYALLIVALYELLCRGNRPARRVLRRPAMMAAATGVVLLGLLQLLDTVAPPYDPIHRRRVGGGAIGHLGHMLSYGAAQTSPHGPRGIASLPWEWLVDLKPIVYLYVDPAHPASGLAGLRPPVHFLGMISPTILLLGIPGLVWLAIRQCHAQSDRLQALALAWFAGAFAPFAVLSLVWQRTSYLYYMLAVMPGIYLAAALAARAVARRHPRVVAGWALSVVLALVALYPLTPLP